MEEYHNKEIDDKEMDSVHVENQQCNCDDCRKRRQYVQILDIDRYVNALNGWD